MFDSSVNIFSGKVVSKTFLTLNATMNMSPFRLSGFNNSFSRRNPSSTDICCRKLNMLQIRSTRKVKETGGALRAVLVNTTTAAVNMLQGLGRCMNRISAWALSVQTRITWIWRELWVRCSSLSQSRRLRRCIQQIIRELSDWSCRTSVWTGRTVWSKQEGLLGLCL